MTFSFNPTEHVGLSLSLYGKGPTLIVTTNGTWSFGQNKGTGVALNINAWNTITLLADRDNCTASINGRVLASNKAASDAFTFQVLLDRYIFAWIDDVSLTRL